MWTEIKVTAFDIVHGSHCTSSCPIALAVMRIVKKGVRVDVDGFQIEFSEDYSYSAVFRDLPMEAYMFVNDFDEKKPVKAFSFKANIPQKFLRQ